MIHSCLVCVFVCLCRVWFVHACWIQFPTGQYSEHFLNFWWDMGRQEDCLADGLSNGPIISVNVDDEAWAVAVLEGGFICRSAASSVDSVVFQFYQTAIFLVGPIIMRDSESASFIAGEGPSLLVAAEIKHTKHNKQHQKLDDGWPARETVPWSEYSDVLRGLCVLGKCKMMHVLFIIVVLSQENISYVLFHVYTHMLNLLCVSNVSARMLG